ncbi:MAG: hypothetical protein ABIG56_04190, partial [Candidatus Omnitrophota bacterium]
MKKKNLLTISIIVFLTLGITSYTFSQDTLTITTYYPSPHGVYRTLKLHPSPQPVFCNEGEMYYDDGVVGAGV